MFIWLPHGHRSALCQWDFRFGTFARPVSDPHHTMFGCEINRRPSKLKCMRSFPADLADAIVRAGQTSSIDAWRKLLDYRI